MQKRAGRVKASLVSVVVLATGIAAPSASAAPGPSGAVYSVVVTCATATATVRIDATRLAGTTPVAYSIEVDGVVEPFLATRGAWSGVTVTGDFLLPNGTVTVREGTTIVATGNYGTTCPNYEATQSAAGRSRFVPITPGRVLDTRPTTRVNYTGAKPAAGGLFDLVMVGQRGIPANASAVVLNVTATEANGPGYVQLFPTAQGTPGSSSNLNVERAGQTIPNAVIVPLGAGGAVSFFTQVGTHLIADVAGYFEPVTGTVTAGRFTGVTPTRVLDTRPQTLINYSGPKPVAGATVTFGTTVVGGPPTAQISAVVLNVTATEATADGYVQAAAAGALVPGASSNLNVLAGQTIPNLVIVPVSATGQVTLFTQSGTHLIADVMGYFTSSVAAAETSGLFVPLRPERVADSRLPSRVDGSGFLGDPGETMNIFFGGLPFFELGAVMLNVTATEAQGAGYVQVGPGLVPGAHSNLNLERAGQTIPNAVLVPVSATNDVDFFTQNGTQIIADIFGWFTY